MATSTEQLNDAITALQGAADAYNGKKAEIDGKIAELMNAKVNLPGALHNLIYVDQMNGNDANDGSQASPVQSLTYAVEVLTPIMGRSDIFLQSDYDMGTEVINLQHGRIVRISNLSAGVTAARARLIPRVFSEDGVDKMTGFFLGGQTQGEAIEFRRLQIEWPDDPGGVAAPDDLNLVTAFSATGGASFSVSLTDTVITVGASPIGNLLNPGGRQVSLAAVPGQYAAGFAGHWVRGLASAATQAQARDVGVSTDLTSL